MPSFTLRLDPRDRAKLVDDVTTIIVGHLRIELRSIADELRQSAHNDNCPGIRVLSPAQAAERRGVSVRHLYRLEAEGRVPRRRRISRRRMGFLSHELDGLPSEALTVRDGRKLSRRDFAEKLGVNERTLIRMLKAREAPAADEDGRWYERDIDAWLLSRPFA